MTTQKAKFYKYIYINQIYQTNFKSFSNQRSDTVSISSSVNSSLSFFLFAFLSFYMKHIFMFSILFKSNLIRHSGTGSAFKDTQRPLEHLRHGRALRDLGTQRALRGHSDTWALE